MIYMHHRTPHTSPANDLYNISEIDRTVVTKPDHSSLAR